MPSPSGENVSVRLKDFKGINTVATAYATFGAGDTVAGITAAIQAWMNLLNNVTGCQIVQARYELKVTPTGAAAARAAGLAGVNAEVGVLLEFPKPTADSPPWSFHIPGLQPACIVGGSPDGAEGSSIDLLSDSMENGATGGTPIAGTTGGFWTSSSGAVLIPVADVKQSTHKHRKSYKRVTGA